MPKTNTIPFSQITRPDTDPDSDDTLTEYDATGNLTLGPDASPEVEGEQDVGGDMTDPAMDDNALDMAQKMGIGIHADEEDPQELNIAKDVEEAEKSL